MNDSLNQSSDNSPGPIGVLLGTQPTQILTILNTIFTASEKTLRSGVDNISNVKLSYDTFFKNYTSKN